jgi:DNA-binding NarL/FixJ family response regulator
MEASLCTTGQKNEGEPHRAISILCVDDNEWIGEAIQRFLKRQPEALWLGCCSSTAAIADALAKDTPTVILLDVEIPGEDSFAILRMLADRHPEVKVLMLSGHVHHDVVDRALRCGAWGYVYKGETIETIWQLVRSAVQGRIVLSPAVDAEYRSSQA